MTPSLRYHAHKCVLLKVRGGGGGGGGFSFFVAPFFPLHALYMDHRVLNCAGVGLHGHSPCSSVVLPVAGKGGIVGSSKELKCKWMYPDCHQCYAC